ncbi:PaaI family thioesterase [Paenibacillus solisilvae]|uniref:PaaI family thioesterase n=1 Tax=Paenibacillus solisilvae TaxID=2486751 RepID=A0ABW0VV65_9BACL
MTEERSNRQMNSQAEALLQLAEAAKSTFWGYLGCEIVHLEQEKVTISLDAQPHHLNLLNLIHGGVLASLLDNAMGLVVLQLCPDEKTVTAYMNIHYLKSSGVGILTCDAELIHRSKRTLTTQSRIYGDDGELLAWGSGSYRIVK